MNKYYTDLYKIVLAAIPALLNPVMTLLSGIVSDFLVGQRQMKTTTVRKIMSTSGLCVAGSSIALAGHVGCNAPMIVFFLSFSLSFNGVTCSGFKANHVEIAPGRTSGFELIFVDFDLGLSGLTFAMANTFASLLGNGFQLSIFNSKFEKY